MSDESEVTTSSSESEDEEPDDVLEKDFFKTLSHLKNKDPVIYDQNVTFFSESEVKKESKNTKDERMFLRDYNREVLLGGLDEKGPTYVEEQNELKKNFKSLIENDSDDDEVLKKKEKTDKEKQEEEEEYLAWLKGKKDDISDKNEEGVLKPLRDYWNNPNLDEGEEFLKDYILNQRWKGKEEIEDDENLSEDGELLEAQEDFEREYNFKNEENTELKRFPRTVEGSVRKKDDSRKKKRAEIKEKKKEEKEKKKLEIQKAQKTKLEEIKTRLEKLKEMTGNETLGVDDNDIVGDFDSEKHDKMMSQLYGDDFYSKEDDFEIPDFEENTTRSKKKKERKRKKKKVTDITDIINPEDENFDKVADEFYSLECEDFIDDVPCRFKYREVVPNDYGLTVEEILAADDTELNKWVPLSKLYKIRPKHVEKNEIGIYKKKGRDYKLKEKLLPSLFKKEETESDEKRKNDDSNVEEETESDEKRKNDDSNVEEETESDEKRKNDDSNVEEETESDKKRKNDDSNVEEEPPKKKQKEEPESPKNIKKKSPKKAKKKKSNGEIKEEVKQEKTDDTPNKMSVRAKKNLKKKLKKANQPQVSKPQIKSPNKVKNKKFKAKKEPAIPISDTRLLAYDIKPKKFKGKLKFGNS